MYNFVIGIGFTPVNQKLRCDGKCVNAPTHRRTHAPTHKRSHAHTRTQACRISVVLRIFAGKWECRRHAVALRCSATLSKIPITIPTSQLLIISRLLLLQLLFYNVVDITVFFKKQTATRRRRLVNVFYHVHHNTFSDRKKALALAPTTVIHTVNYSV